MALHSLLQLSDPHITAKGGRAYGRVDTYGMFASAIDWIESLPTKADALVVTGDLVYSGTRAEYEALKALLSPVSIPVYLLPGNHDDRSLLRDVFSDHDYLRQSLAEHICYEISLPERRVLCLDTSVPGKSHGELSGIQLDWLSEQLETVDGRPVMIAMHHPPFQTHIAYMDNIGLLQGREELAELLNHHTHVDRVIAGHLHRFIVANIGRCAAVTSPSTAHQIMLQFERNAPGMWIMEPPGALLHVWEDRQPTITHQIALGKADGPYPFRG